MSKTAILFPGQGAQYLNMGNDYFKKYDKYKEIIDLASQHLNNLAEVVYGTDEEILNDTLYTQFAISSMELGIFNVIKQKLQFDAVAGFSLGEYVALCASGVLTEAEMFSVINLRTKYMKEAVVDGAMIAVLRVSYETVQTHLNNLKTEKNIDAYVANYNSSEQVVLACTNDVIDDVVQYLKDQGIRKVVPLKVSGPFHSIYYQEAAMLFKQSISQFNFEQPQKDLYLNVTGTKYNGEDFTENCAKHMYQQVNWYPLILQMIEDGITTFVEVGPGQVLSGLMKKINKDVTVLSIATVEDLDKLEELK